MSILEAGFPHSREAPGALGSLLVVAPVVVGSAAVLMACCALYLR